MCGVRFCHDQQNIGHFLEQAKGYLLNATQLRYVSLQHINTMEEFHPLPALVCTTTEI